MTTMQAEEGGRREQLLAAAREVLAEHGYERTTVSSIATRANVAQGTFYLYFPSKESLPGALALEVHRALGHATERATADAVSLQEALEDLVRETYVAGEQFRDVLLIANRGVELCADFNGFLEMTAPWRDALEGFIRRFQERGEIESSLDVTTTACVLRDVLDRSLKARVLFGNTSYAESVATLSHRALSV
jgi:AcrR family transcriptional regulator